MQHELAVGNALGVMVFPVYGLVLGHLLWKHLAQLRNEKALEFLQIQRESCFFNIFIMNIQYIIDTCTHAQTSVTQR